MEKKKQLKQPKLNYANTMILGTGFMVITMAWSLFNSYVPIFLRTFITSSTLIGVIMVLDNLAGMTIQPLISAFSDKTWTKRGRRMPYLIAGMPLAALFFVFLPFNFTLFTLMLSVVMVDLSMSIFRGPTVALMPDLTEPKLRSKANGIINFMGGIGAFIALFFGSYLYAIHPVLPFAMTSVFMILVLFVLVKKIKEPTPEQLSQMEEDGEVDGEEAPIEQRGLIKSLVHVITDADRRCFYLLLAIFLWFMAWNGIEPWFTTYGVVSLGMEEHVAARLQSYLPAAMVLFAIPAGFIGAKFGKKRTIKFGLIGFALTLISFFWFRTAGIMGILFFLGGICWSLININSYPLVIEMGKGGKSVGTYTGLYYFFSSIAAVVAPIFFGKLIDVFDPAFIFIAAFVFLVLAFYMMVRLTFTNDKMVNTGRGLTT